MPCASTGSSSSSSVTTTAYSSNGYGPKQSSKAAIISPLPGEVVVEAAAQPGGTAAAAPGSPPDRQLDQVVPADLDGHQVGGHRRSDARTPRSWWRRRGVRETRSPVTTAYGDGAVTAIR
jgi:hypothetical protein